MNAANCKRVRRRANRWVSSPHAAIQKLGLCWEADAHLVFQFFQKWFEWCAEPKRHWVTRATTATVCLLCCHRAKDTEISTVVPPDDTAAIFLRLWYCPKLPPCSIFKVFSSLYRITLICKTQIIWNQRHNVQNTGLIYVTVRTLQRGSQERLWLSEAEWAQIAKVLMWYSVECAGRG